MMVMLLLRWSRRMVRMRDRMIMRRRRTRRSRGRMGMTEEDQEDDSHTYANRRSGEASLKYQYRQLLYTRQNNN